MKCPFELPMRKYKAMNQKYCVEDKNGISFVTCLTEEKAEYLEFVLNKYDILKTSCDILLEAVKKSYRKHVIGDENVGWDELGMELCDALCETMGDNEYQKWAGIIRDNLSKEAEKI